MNIPRAIIIAAVFSFVLIGPLSSSVHAQKDKNTQTQTPAPALKRSTSRHETHRLSYGGTVTILGAPAGAITIEGWQRSEVEITAEIELQAGTDADLDLLARINNFTVDVDTNHIRIITTGTHDKNLLKKVAKKFPKSLLGLPWKIDFRVKVPIMTDLEIDSGVGPVKLDGVEGAIRLNALHSDADLTLTGGYFRAIIQRGAVNFRIPARNWRGLGSSLQLAGGTLDVSLMPGFSGEIDATVLRMGEIKNSYPALAPRERTSFSSRLLEGRAGAGGARLSFTVGDGRIEIKQTGSAQ